jgi:hypothetical protein
LWSELKTLVKVESSRTVKGAETKEIRYYISDEEGHGAAYFNTLVRGHWGIENQDLLVKYILCSFVTRNDMDCPRCGSLRHVKSGIIQGVQRHRCKDYGRN